MRKLSTTNQLLVLSLLAISVIIYLFSREAKADEYGVDTESPDSCIPVKKDSLDMLMNAFKMKYNLFEMTYDGQSKSYEFSLNGLGEAVPFLNKDYEKLVAASDEKSYKISVERTGGPVLIKGSFKLEEGYVYVPASILFKLLTCKIQ